jgi:hypothetical protein
MGASTSTGVAMAHCKVYEHRVASELRARWAASGSLVMEYAQTTGAMRLHAMAPAVHRTTAPSLTAATGTTTSTGSAGDRLICWPRRVGLTSTWTRPGQPVWTVHPLPLQPSGVELLVVDDDDAFVGLDVLAPGLGVDRDDITIKPRAGWCGYGDPRLDSRRRPPPWP